MNRRELEEAIVRAAEIVGQNTVIVIGSQAILASFSKARLPERATMSNEVDIAPEHDLNDILSNRLWLEAGQGSDWAADRDFFIDAVSANTAYLPDGWRSRAIEVRPEGHPDIIGVCPEPHDLCASKLARNEDKDREFVAELVNSGLIQLRLLRNRLDEIRDPRLEPARKKAAQKWVRDLIDHKRDS